MPSVVMPSVVAPLLSLMLLLLQLRKLNLFLLLKLKSERQSFNFFFQKPRKIEKWNFQQFILVGTEFVEV